MAEGSRLLPRCFRYASIFTSCCCAPPPPHYSIHHYAAASSNESKWLAPESHSALFFDEPPFTSLSAPDTTFTLLMTSFTFTSRSTSCPSTTYPNTA